MSHPWLKHGLTVAALALFTFPLFATLPGCGGDDDTVPQVPGPGTSHPYDYTGRYLGTAIYVARTAILDLTVLSSGEANGTLWFPGGQRGPADNAALNGMANFQTGAFTLTGVYHGATTGANIPVTVTGALPRTDRPNGTWTAEVGEQDISGPLTFVPPDTSGNPTSGDPTSGIPTDPPPPPTTSDTLVTTTTGTTTGATSTTTGHDH